MPAEPLTALEREETRVGIVQGEPDGLITQPVDGRHQHHNTPGQRPIHQTVRPLSRLSELVVTHSLVD